VLNAVRGKIISCEYTLAVQPGTTVDPSRVNVVYTDGGGGAHIIPQDPNAGWTYDDPNQPHRVILHGSACDQVKNDGKASVSIMLGCKTEVPR